MRRPIRAGALVSTYFDTLPPSQAQLAQAVRQAVLTAGPELDLTVKWGQLVFTWKGRTLLTLAMQRSHGHLQLHNTVPLPSPAVRPDGAGQGQRLVKLRVGAPLDEAVIASLVKASLAQVAAGA